MTLWQRYLAGLAVMVTAMTLAWLWQRRRTNAGIVDVVWSFGTGAMCALLAMGGAAPLGRRVLISGLALVWACRLGIHLFRRVTGESEDGRYQSMRASFGQKAQIGFFAFFQIQAIWTLMFATPLYFAAGSPAQFPQWFDFAGGLVWLMSVGGEALADAQLARFRNDPANKGKVCDTGLWRYSRHPNYFFEWLHWFTYVLIGVGSPYWWATLFGPVVMGVFLYKVTGIPFTEKRALQSRGEAYRKYQETTSAFIPWPPKKNEGERMSETTTSLSIDLMERGLVPDALIRRGIRGLCAQRLREENRGDCECQQESLTAFIDQMDAGPIAPVPEKANEQHYELPPEFFGLALGKHRKYSSTYWPDSVKSLDEAEARGLALTCEHADLSDGMDVLELGCGWGSLSLWMAEKYPASRIVGVSNSAPQRAFILDQAHRRGLNNLEIITADMNAFTIDRRFDRVVSVEMFEHMRNYRKLFGRVANWLRPGGKFFMHIFVHQTFAYEFQTEGSDNWLGKYFFTGGIMPSDELPLHFQDDLTIARRWRWGGGHYEKTANAWLANLDANKSAAMAILIQSYGAAEAARWFNRWRVFFMACAELWGYRDGQEWFVSHYLFNKPVDKELLK